MFVRILKIALLVVAVIIVVLAIAAWFSGERTHLPMEYEGFD